MLSNLVLAEPQAKLKSGRVSSGQGVLRDTEGTFVGCDFVCVVVGVAAY